VSTQTEEQVDSSPKFPLGRVVATVGALEALVQAGQKPEEFLARHQAGDWGEMPPEDIAENEFSLKNDLRLMSAYTLSNEVKIWIITEHDRSVTTILLPTEY